MSEIAAPLPERDTPAVWWRPTLVQYIAGFLYGVLVLLWALLSSGVVGITMLLPFWVLPRGRRERFTIVGTSLWARGVLAALFVRVRTTGGQLDRHSGGALLISNHRSWLDPLLLIARTASNGLSKREIGWIPLIGQFAWLGGAVFFDRRNPRARKRARADVLRLLQGGFRVQLFPEGTRTRDGHLRDKVHFTLMLDCHAAGVPVIPCAVRHTEHVLPPGIFGAFPGQEVGLWVGEAVHPSDFEDPADFAAHCWQQVVDHVEES